MNNQKDSPLGVWYDAIDDQKEYIVGMYSICSTKPCKEILGNEFTTFDMGSHRKLYIAMRRFIIPYRERLTFCVGHTDGRTISYEKINNIISGGYKLLRTYNSKTARWDIFTDNEEDAVILKLKGVPTLSI